MTTELRTSQVEIAVGQRWEDRDWRDSGRVIEVERVSGDCVFARVVAAPRKPWTIRRATRLRADTLRRRYRQLGHEALEGEG